MAPWKSFLTGRKSRNTGDRIIAIIAINERVVGICGVVLVLAKYIKEYPGDATIEKWMDDLIKSEEKQYTLANKSIPIIGIDPSLQSPSTTPNKEKTMTEAQSRRRAKSRKDGLPDATIPSFLCSV